jgi:hypothetical protein
MQKSGTGWFCNLTNGLVAATGGHDTRKLRTTSPRLGRVISEHNCGIGPPTARKLAVLSGYHLRGKRFAVKTHGPPTPVLRDLMVAGAVRSTYQYRDLRDVALSVLDHRLKVRDTRPNDPMARVKTLDDACRFVGKLFPTWQAWTQLRDILTVRYEDLHSDPVGQVRRLAAHLGVAFDDDSTRRLLERHPVGAGSAEWDDGLHFNKGQVGRFAEILSRAELDVCNELLGPQLRQMGYELV